MFFEKFVKPFALCFALQRAIQYFIKRILLFRYFIKPFIKGEKLGADFIWAGRLFQSFQPKTRKRLTILHLIWSGYIKIQQIFYFRAGFFESDNLKMSVIIAGLRRFIVLYLSN